MDLYQMWWLIGMCAGFMLVGVWVGWECWGKRLKYAVDNAAIMDAGYRLALERAVEALATWEQTRGDWKDDGTTTTPGPTAMLMACALGYARTALVASRKTPNVEANRPPTARGTT